MNHGKRQGRWKECFARQVQQNGGVFANRIQQNRRVGLRSDALATELALMEEAHIDIDENGNVVGLY